MMLCGVCWKLTFLHLSLIEKSQQNIIELVTRPAFFQPSSYTLEVGEDTSLHTSIGRVFAKDADEGVNGEIYFR